MNFVFSISKLRKRLSRCEKLCAVGYKLKYSIKFADTDILVPVVLSWRGDTVTRWRL